MRLEARTVAATGTVDVDGEVGPVGGVTQKALAAEEAGASFFLVPFDEVEKAEDTPCRWAAWQISIER
jgi:Lon-like protease